MTLSAFTERSLRNKEDWKYTDLASLLLPLPLAGRVREGGGILGTALQNKGSARLLFLNGIFQTEKSHFGTIPSCILMGDLESGYSITLGERTCLVAQPIELVFITDNNAPDEINLKFFVDIGENGRLTLLENHLASNTVVTIETEVNLQKRAKFVHGKIIQGGAHLAMNNVNVDAGGFYCDYALLRGGSPIRNETAVNLNGKEAQTSINCAMLLRGEEHADMTTRISHLAPQCSSRQICKTVLNDKSRGVFQGKISVAPDAQKSDAYQLSRALLLSDKAEMDAKPELEILADDVKCSHGSAIGDLDADAMFYLRSRGVEENQARALLIESFLNEVIDDISVEEWREVFRNIIHNRIA